MLAARPELATYSIATEIVLGKADLVRQALQADYGLVARVDPDTGWTALNAVSASRRHKLDPARADGLLAIARMLLDARADPEGGAGPARTGRGWNPLRCAVAGAGAANPAIVRLLLEAGADPNRFVADNDRYAPVLHEAVQAGCGPELIELLASHGADLEAVGPDHRTAHALAVSQGRTEVADVLRRGGARTDASSADALLSALLRADRSAVYEQVARHPGLLGELSEGQRGAGLARAAETGNAAAIGIMLDLGFPIESRGGDHGATALHTAACSGSANVVRLLLERGANVEAHDANWDSTALVWANIGSSERARGNPQADWLAAVRALLDAGASIEGAEDDDHPPSPDVAELLRQHGVPDVGA